MNLDEANRQINEMSAIHATNDKQCRKRERLFWVNYCVLNNAPEKLMKTNCHQKNKQTKKSYQIDKRPKLGEWILVDRIQYMPILMTKSSSSEITVCWQ